MYDISSPSKTNRSAQIPHQNNSVSKGLVKAVPLKELGVAESFGYFCDQKYLDMAGQAAGKPGAERHVSHFFCLVLNSLIYNFLIS